MAVMEIEEIMEILPHRYPFQLVDRIIETDDKRWIVGIKNVTINEHFFAGHFPGHPVMPGVLQIEAMAQTCGVLMSRSLKQEGKIAYFLAVDKCRFRRVVKPGDQLRIEVTIKNLRLGASKVHGEITVDGELAAEADLMFAYKPE